jgi:hypothetical protein
VLIAPALPLALIHPTAWKVNSANFALTEVSEVRLLMAKATVQAYKQKPKRKN